MEPWKTRVDNSVAIAQATIIKNLADAADLSTLPPEYRERISHAIVVSDTTLEKLKNADPMLVSVNALDSLGSSLSNAAAELNSWTTSANVAYLDSMETMLDAAVIQLAVLTPDMDVPEAKEAIARLRQSVAANINRADELIDKLKERGSSADIAIDEKVASAKAEFEKLEEDLVKLETDIETARTSNAAIITDQTAAYNAAESARTAKFTEQLSQTQTALNVKLEQLETDANTELEKIKTSAQKDLETIKGHKSEVERILKIVGEEALIGDYSKRAKSENWFAEGWAGGTLLSILLAIGFAIDFAKNVSSLNDQSLSISWQYVLAKLVIVSSFGALAAYCARQSGEHRSAQRDSELMSLQLASLPQYVKNVTDQSKRDDLLKELAVKLFGKPAPVFKSKVSKDDNPLVATQLAEALIELVKKAKF